MEGKHYKAQSSGFLEVNEFNLPSMSEEEIKKFELEEGLTELDKAKLLLKKKNTAQMVSVLVNLPILFRERQDAVDALLPVILTWEEKLQVEAGDAFAAIVSNKVREYKCQILQVKDEKHLFATSLAMLKIWSAEVASRWIEVLHLLVKSLPASATHEELVSLLLSLSDISQPHGSRIVAAQLIGIMAESFQASAFLGKPLERTLNLCSDFNWEVRRRIASKLTQVCSKVGTQMADEHLFKELTELMDDEEVEVEMEALLAWVQSLPIFSKPLLRAQGTKVLSSLLESEHLQIRDMLVEHCGRIIDGVSWRCNDQLGYEVIALDETREKGELLGALLKLVEDYSRFKSEKYQKLLVAYNLPALMALLPDELFVDRVLPIFMSLAKIDSSLAGTIATTAPIVSKPGEEQQQLVVVDEVRNRLGAGIHEIFREKGAEWVLANRVDETLFTLLEEGKSSVVAAIIGHLAPILRIMHDFQEPIQDRQLRFVTNMLKLLPMLNSKMNGNWRAQFKLLDNFSEAMAYLSPDQILKVVQSLHLPVLHQAVEPIKILICQTLCSILATTPHYHLRNYLHEHIVKDFAISRSYRDRLAFIDFCGVAQGYLSKQYFKVSFLANLLEMGKDKVAGVLIKFCLNIQMVRKWIASEDTKYLEKLEKTLRDMDKLARGLKMGRVIECVEMAHASLEDKAFEELLGDPEIQSLEKARQHKEHDLHRSEKKAMELQKKKEIEEMVQQSKNEYLTAVTLKNKATTKSAAKMPKIDPRGSAKLTSSGKFAVSPLGSATATTSLVPGAPGQKGSGKTTTGKSSGKGKKAKK